LEKSATARVAARISLSSLSRFSRSGLSSTLTVTLSKKASTWGGAARHGGHGGLEILGVSTARSPSAFGDVDRHNASAFSSGCRKALGSGAPVYSRPSFFSSMRMMLVARL
jgi:hypothetical protein